nr:FmdB family transcriptional regulator [Actinomycetales bacterium]
MPTYAYRCTECSTEFDVYQRFDEDSLTTCPSCQGVLRKLFTPAGVLFKGSGFYRTDSRASSGKTSSGKSAGGSSSGASNGGSSSSGSSSSGAGSGTSGSSRTSSTGSSKGS